MRLCFIKSGRALYGAKALYPNVCVSVLIYYFTIRLENSCGFICLSSVNSLPFDGITMLTASTTLIIIDTVFIFVAIFIALLIIDLSIYLF